MLTKEQQKKIRIGTSGYSFPDWKETFYPRGLASRDWLRYYARFFGMVELNVIYYRLPTPSAMRTIAAKTPPDFQFLVKANQEMTHKRENASAAYAPFRECLQPMREAGKLAGVLAQFPYSFKPSQTNREHLVRLRDEVPDTMFAVEFRHARWLTDETFAHLQKHAITYTVVDEPDLPNLVPPHVQATTGTGYVRLHGRNREHWYGSGGERYDYNYSDEELEECSSKAESLLDAVEVLYILFNNCHLGQAARNALQMQEMLLGGPVDFESDTLFAGL